MTEAKILPCPFCGSDEISHGSSYPPFAQGRSGIAQCHTCDACMLGEDEEDAISAWNKRQVEGGEAKPFDASDEMVAAALKVDWSNEDEVATVHNVWHAMLGAIPARALLSSDTGGGGDTGSAEADRIIDRLMSSDPDFNDCTDAAALIRRLVIEHKGPDDFPTWKDAAIAERVKAKDALSSLRVENEELRAGLSFYADPANWIDTPPWEGDPECITPKAIPVHRDEDGAPCDCGDRARSVLAAREGK